MIIKKQNKSTGQSAQQVVQPQPTMPQSQAVVQPQPTPEVEAPIDLFDLDNIDFSQRQERRRGDRRRG